MAECQISLNLIPNPNTRELTLEMLGNGTTIGAVTVELEPMFQAWAAANPTSNLLPTVEFADGPGAAVNNASNYATGNRSTLWEVHNVPFSGDGLFWVNRDTNGDWYWKQLA